MSTPNAIPISAGLSAEDVGNLSDEVLRALMSIDSIRARAVINSTPKRYVPGAPSAIINPGPPQFQFTNPAFR